MTSKEYKYLNKLLLKALKGHEPSILQLAASLGTTYTNIKAHLSIVNKEIDKEAERLCITREEVIKRYGKKNNFPVT